MYNWYLLSEAISFYEAIGYRYIEVPWIVPEHIAKVTFPGEALSCQIGSLIGSAEQGFLAIDLEEGKYVSCSPCFRNEPIIDDQHQIWFMKVELYYSGSHVEEVLKDASDFLSRYLDIQIALTHEGFDIMASDIEIGSYGERKTDDRHWTYGTGLALPRFSLAIERQKP